MKIWLALPVLLGMGAALQPPSAPKSGVLLLTGDSRGSLGPCGCTKPMTGGIKRLATLVRAYRVPGRTTLVVNGDLTGGYSRQEELKAQALGETLARLQPAAVRLGSGDANSPQGSAILQSFLSDAVLADDHPIDSGNFRLLAESPALGRQIQEARIEGKRVGLMIDGGRQEARSLARTYPEIAWIQYRLDGRGEWSKEGSTLLLTPGSKIRDLVIVPEQDGQLLEPKVVALEEHVADDPDARGIYRAYLVRVDKEDLLGQVPREGNERFVGSSACGKCHGSAITTWRHSKHAVALRSLETEGHGKDPECVSCHVVGLDRTNGFRDRAQTPQLADVGCEACHGAGEDHSRAPKQAPFPRLDKGKCLSCHTSEQSPGFDFNTFWRQIRH